METASRELLRARGSSRRLGDAALLVLVASFVALVAVGAVAAVSTIRELDNRRAALPSAAPDPAASAGPAAEAFRTFRDALDDGSRFALVYGAEVGRDQRGFYRLFAGYYLYPAVAVERPEDADAVMVFGEPSAVLRASFDELGSASGVWLGTRREQT